MLTDDGMKELCRQTVGFPTDEQWPGLLQFARAVEQQARARTDRQALRGDLTRGFILREFADKFGVMSSDFEPAAYDRYNNDPTFNRRVKQAVAETMVLVERHTRQ